MINSCRNEPRVGERILVISPAKDEEEFIEQTIHSIAWQTLRPRTWVIVNDGSCDRTGAIAEEAACKFPWIHVVHLSPGRRRRVGPGVVEAFYAGLDSVNLDDYDYVCKLDADIHLPHFYFGGLIDEFRRQPRLGTISGKCYIPINGRLVLERTGDEFTHGTVKLYRKECFQEIGGFIREVMWDGIDCHRCRMKGWDANSVANTRFAIIHLRQMGASHKNVLHGRRRWGRGQYYMGTHLPYMLAITLYRMAERPWVIGGLNIMWGYLWSLITRQPRYQDPQFRRHLRRWQWTKLTGLLLPRSIRNCYGRVLSADVVDETNAGKDVSVPRADKSVSKEETQPEVSRYGTNNSSAVAGVSSSSSLDDELATSGV